MRGGDVRMEGGGHRGEGVVARGGYVRHGGGAVGADSEGFAKGGEAVNRVLDGLAWVVAHWVHWHRWRGRRLWMATEDAHVHHSYAALAQSEFIAEMREQQFRAEQAALRLRCCEEASLVAVFGRRECGWICPAHGNTEPAEWHAPSP